MQKLDISLFKLYCDYRNIRRDPEDGFSSFIERYESLRAEVEKSIYRRFSALHVQILDLLTACNIAIDDVESILSGLESESTATNLCNLYDNVKESLKDIASEYEGLTFTKEEVEDDDYQEEKQFITDSKEFDNLVIVRFRQEEKGEVTNEANVVPEFDDYEMDTHMVDTQDDDDWPSKGQKDFEKVQKVQRVLSSSEFPKLPMAFDELCKHQSKVRTFATQVKRYFYPHRKWNDYSADFPLWSSYEAPVTEFTQTARDILKAGDIEGSTFCLESVLPWSTFHGFEGQFSNGPKVKTDIGFTNILKLLIQVGAIYSGVNLEDSDAICEEQDHDKKPKVQKKKKLFKKENDSSESEDDGMETDDVWPTKEKTTPKKVSNVKGETNSRSGFPKLPMAFDELCKHQTKVRSFGTQVKRHFYPFTHIGYSADFPLWSSYEAPVSEFTQTAKDILKAGDIEGSTFCLESVLPWSSFHGFQGQFSGGPKVSTSIGFTNILKLLIQVGAIYSGVNLEDSDAVCEEQEQDKKPKVKKKKSKKSIKYFKNTEGRFPCNSCGKDFSTVKHLRIHINVNHEEKVNCHLCGKPYPKWTLKAHIHRVHGKPKLKTLAPCPKCGKILTMDTLRHAHKCEKDPDDLYSCDLCDFTTYYRESLRGHKERIHNPDTFPCEICGNLYTSAQSLRNHIKQVHDSGDLKCHLCDFQAKAKPYLDSHIRSVHNSSKSFMCAVCSFESENKQDLLSHMQLKHGQFDPSPQKEAPTLLIKCDSCDRQFNSRKSWRVHHKSVHLGIRYQCEYENCTFSTTTKAQVKRHVELKHLGIKLQCEYCEKSFCGDGSLRDHKVKKHPDQVKFYSCHLCSYRTEHKDLLQRHLTGKYGKHN